jgi:3D (Asp-Asp-Asp) domain-containing protein
MRISHSLWRKLVVTFVTVAGIVLVYQATILDSKYAARQALLREDKADPGPGARLRFEASAYCKGDVTASGLPPRSGIAAADPAVLPAGSVIQVGKLGPQWDGVYTILDTGPVVTGRRLDLYTWSCNDALRLGRRSPSLLDTLLPWRDKSKPAAKPAARPKPSTELPQFPTNR